MSSQSLKPTDPAPSIRSDPSAQTARQLKALRRRRHKLISLAYALGLLLVFLLSLALLPSDTGLGKLLLGTADAGANASD